MKKPHEGPPEGMDTFSIKSRPSQTHDVDPSNCVGAVHDAKWRDVAAGAREPAQDGQGADAHELMHDAVAGDKSPIFHLHIAGQQSPTGNDRVITDLAVMRHMGVVHEEIVVADNGGAAFGGTAVDLTVFANDIAVADLEETLPAFVGDVLRDVPNDRAHVDFVVFADVTITGEHGMGQDAGAATDPYRAVNHDVGADISLGMDLGARVNQSGWVNGHEA